jgi:hypothetical protein
MKRNIKTALRNMGGFLFLICLSFNLIAQTNFAGNWGLNESRSNFGDSQFRRASSAMVVTQDAKVMTVESTRQSRDGAETKVTVKYNLDGSVSENPGRNTTRKSTITWSADKTAMTINSTMVMDNNGETREIKSSETWKLTDAGKMLMIESSRKNQDGADVKTTAAYDKK